ncbi:MAG: hypothetical protein R2761_15620 [Acidimicrobiales bacterium]
MAVDTDPIELLEIQGSTDLVTKADLMRAVRGTGRSISDRNLTFYGTLGLLPKALRVGARSGAYPKIVAELACWVIDARERDLPIEAIKELLPLWRYLARAQRTGRFDVGEIEFIARQHIKREDANREVPWLIGEMTHRGQFRPDGRTQVTWTLKDGQTQQPEERENFRLSFVLTEFDPRKNEARVVAWTQLVLPGFGLPTEDDPATIWLGAPVGVRVCREPSPRTQTEFANETAEALAAARSLA